MEDRCRACGSRIDGSTELCPSCGAPLARPGVPGNRRRLVFLLGGLGLAIVIALWARHLAGPAGSPCRGGADASATETRGRTAPRMTVSVPGQIDPETTPHIRVGVVRHTGTRTYGEKSDRQWGHYHEPVAAALRGLGANAFIHEATREVGDDRVEVTTIAVVAHPGPVPAAVEARHFRDGRAAMVSSVVAGSGAEKGGIRTNDLIVRIAGQAPLGPEPGFAAKALMRVAQPGSTVVFEVVRAGALVSLRLVKEGEQFGIHLATVPILRVTP